MQTHWCAVEKTKNAKKICDEMFKNIPNAM